MQEHVFGMDWAEFIAALKSGTSKNPFLVCEKDDDGKDGWFLYATTPRILVQVVTSRRRRRCWRSLDGAFSEIRRDLQPMLMIAVYSSADLFNVNDLLARGS